MNLSSTNEKYSAILKTAHNLFWKFGTRRVTIEEVCREAGVSKMTFYRFFANKSELALEVSKNLFDKLHADYKQVMNENASFEDKVKKQLMMKFQGTHDISPELVKDVYGDPASGLFKYWKTRTDEMMKVVMNDYRHAQKMGWIRKDLNLDFFMYMANKSIEMSSDPRLLAMYPDLQSLIMEIANMIFFGIFPRKNEK